MYENLEEEINFFYQSILEKTPRYPFICIYGIGNALLIKNLAKHYKHLFVFESEIELFILALSTIDLSEELKVYKVVLFDCVAKDLEIQIAMIFDQQSILEYLSLYEMFISSHYYLKYYETSILSLNELCIKSASVAIRNADITCFLPLLTHGQFLQNIPSMLESIPFQRILSQRKNKFENAIVVSAGPSLAKQLPLLKACQDKAVIFCADGALSMLEKEGIVPDYVTNLDFTDLAMKFFQNKENLKQSIIALECATHPNIVRSLNAENCMIVLRNKALYQRFNLNDFGYIDTGTHVSHFSYTLALALGFKNIIMIGQDLAFDKEGNSHSKGFDFGEKFSGEENIDKLKVPAYAGKGEVLTHIQRFNLNDFGYIDTGTHVSHFSYTLALALGFKNIIMIGQDLAFDKEGNSHSKGFDFGEKFSGEENIDKLKVPAYAGKGEVLTHITWNDYRIKLEYLFACNDQKAKFYNATEGGARINFTEELSFKECCEKFLTKEKPKFELPKSLTKNRSDKLLVKFKEKIQKDQENAKRFLDDALALKQILENILSKDFILPLEFLEKVYQNIENFNHSLDEDEFIQD
ncbi:motility associated factor glycosyltransferase family protein, partial [Campylobacter jejuni]